MSGEVLSFILTLICLILNISILSLMYLCFYSLSSGQSLPLQWLLLPLVFRWFINLNILQPRMSDNHKHLLKCLPTLHPHLEMHKHLKLSMFIWEVIIPPANLFFLWWIGPFHLSAQARNMRFILKMIFSILLMTNLFHLFLKPSVLIPHSYCCLNDSKIQIWSM